MDELIDGQVEVECEVAQEKPVGGWVFVCESAAGTAKESRGTTKDTHSSRWGGSNTRLAGRWSKILVTNTNICRGSR